jgi:hypothetical protein
MLAAETQGSEKDAEDPWAQPRSGGVSHNQRDCGPSGHSLRPPLIHPTEKPLTVKLSVESTCYRWPPVRVPRAAQTSLANLPFNRENLAPPNVTILTLEVRGSATEAAESSHWTAIPAGRLRVLVGFKRKTIADGAVAVLHLSVEGQAEAGTTTPIRMTAPSGSTAGAEVVKMSGSNDRAEFKTGRNAP